MNTKNYYKNLDCGCWIGKTKFDNPSAIGICKKHKMSPQWIRDLGIRKVIAVLVFSQ